MRKLHKASKRSKPAGLNCRVPQTSTAFVINNTLTSGFRITSRFRTALFHFKKSSLKGRVDAAAQANPEKSPGVLGMRQEPLAPRCFLLYSGCLLL